MNIFLKGIYIGETTLKEHDVFRNKNLKNPLPFEKDKDYEFLFSKENYFGKITIATNYSAYDDRYNKTYTSFAEFLKEWKNVSLDGEL